MKKKDMYVSPQVEVIEMENEGVIASSQLPGVGDGGSTRAIQSKGYNSAASSDLEDMINDILTIE
ncbi:hypothetical protein [Bacteroides sp.]|uniref:hypothetical protein n=1 Tax=Bacteroides sp. TaxID=29523 RepID=UPI002619ADC1|nr:hypothetical protein [Bacteroides sp.]